MYRVMYRLEGRVQMYPEMYWEFLYRLRSHEGTSGDGTKTV